MDGNETIIHSRLSALAEAKDYFGLRDYYLAHGGSLDEKQSLYWSAVCENLFGSEYRSLCAARKYLSAYGEKDGDAGEILYISAINRLRRFRYRAAAADYRKLLKLHRHSMDGEEIEEAEGNLSVCRALKNVPPQSVHLNGIRKIPLSKTSFGHLTARVSSGERTGNFIIDTGANFSTVTRSAALGMGLVEVPDTIEVGTATGIRLKCALAYAPQLSLAGITVRNAIFILMEDSQLDFPEIGYSIEGIIGLPVIRQLGDLKFTPGHIRIGNVRIPVSARGNICLEGLMPLVRVASHGEDLTFTLDTGANQSEYSHGYYTKNRESLEQRARSFRGLRGGGGGVVSHKTLMLKNETLSVAGRRMTVPAMNVILEDYEFSRGRDGNLGLDALMSGGGFSLSFTKMALYPGAKKKRKNKGLIPLLIEADDTYRE